MNNSAAAETQKVKILIWRETTPNVKAALLARAQVDLSGVADDVRYWINEVRNRGDEALLEYTRKFDKPDFDIRRLRVSMDDIDQALKRLDPELLAAIEKQIEVVTGFHAHMAASLPRQVAVENIPGLVTGYKRMPIDSAGLYVPAGKAPLPSTAMMLTVAAKTAGVGRAVVCFPPNGDHDAIICAAHLSGADEIYRVGGIAGIAALALGTETIGRVQKIAGPGSTYVQAAKLQLIDCVGIDMLSGPSEIMVLADDSANPVFIASDILGQCEHGPDSASVLVTTSLDLAKKVVEEIELQRTRLSRGRYLDKALQGYTACVVVESMAQALDLVNAYMPEHLEIMTRDPQREFADVRHAGSVFLGDYAPVAAGDYTTGTNHCLPTGQAVAHASAVGPETFMKIIQYQNVSRSALQSLAPTIVRVADEEGLDAHKQSVLLRI
jgi:histidinol dehydrogenase